MGIHIPARYSTAALAALIICTVPVAARALKPRQPPAVASGVATFVSARTIRGVADQSIADRTSDVSIRTVDAKGGHVGIGVVYRGVGHALRQFSSHDAVTEVYQVLQGAGTIVTGGTLVNPQRRQTSAEVVAQLNGPGVSGSGIERGTSQRLTIGDAIIIPAGVPHGFSDIDDTMTIMVVRIDPSGIVALK